MGPPRHHRRSMVGTSHRACCAQWQPRSAGRSATCSTGSSSNSSPTALRAYPIPALLWTAAGIGVLTALLYTPDDSLTTAFAAPYLIAQIPATFAAAGIYGILNGWLAVDGSTTWWPLTPPPIPVEFNLSLEPDDLTAPAVFETADPESAVDLTPATQISQSTQSARLVFAGLAACQSVPSGCSAPFLSGSKTPH